MSKVFVKPNKLKVKLSRMKRNVPSRFVDVWDSSKSVLAPQRINFTDNHNSAPFFIIGAGRSGNTMLRKLLVENANVCIPPEIPGLGSVIRYFTQIRGNSWENVVKLVLLRFKTQADVNVKNANGFNYNLSNELALNYDVIKYTLLNLPEEKQNLKSIIDTIYQNYASKNIEVSDYIIGDKTPWNTFHLDRILKVYPNAKFIHIVRDSRAVVSSYINSLAYLNNTDIVDASYRWKDSIKKCLKLEKSLCKSQFFQIKYEDLVLHPDEHLQKILSFLELKKEYVNNVRLEDQSLSHHENLNKPITTDFIYSWKKKLTRLEIDKIDSITKVYMKKFCYDL